MIRIPCYVAQLRERIDAPGPPYLLNGKEVSQYFLEGSRGAIDLVLDDSRRHAHEIPPRVSCIDELLLNRALSRVLSSENGDEIGLLFVDRYLDRHDVLGLMFDLGFNPSGSSTVTSDYTRVPREGCAVFCDAIRSNRNPLEVNDEALFTAVHELGHVFNLWHLNHPNDPGTFMASSAKYGFLLPPEAYRFASGDGRLAQKEFLSHCPISDYVRPGGSCFGDRGPLGPPLHEVDGEATSRRSGIRLEISMAQREFWWFEPVELDVSLRVRPGVKRSYRVPDRIDPGYDEFQIWIERPDGERRRYRSPRRYCSAPSFLEIDADRPFERDISIFGQAGGYTFSMPGDYRIEAWFARDSHAALRSNTLEVHLKEARPHSADYRTSRDTLTAPGLARILYHRNVPRVSRRLDRLEWFYRESTDRALAANVIYALGRTLDKVAHRTADRRRRVAYEKRAADCLGRARQSSKLAPHRRRRAVEVLERIGNG